MVPTGAKTTRRQAPIHGFLRLSAFIVGIILGSVGTLSAQHTFSIVAIDPATGQIGSAGATCGDSVLWPGTPGARIISDVIPDLGAIHTQAYYRVENQINAHDRLVDGDTPQQVIDWLTGNDAWTDPDIRQYGIVAFVGDSVQAAAFTGTDCLDEKDHRVGATYSIQGNTLLTASILDSMEAAYRRQTGPLAVRLLAALQAAKIVGADSRCTEHGVSSLSSFLRVAQPGDDPGDLSLDIVVKATPDGIDPIDVLNERYLATLSAPSDERSNALARYTVLATESGIIVLPTDAERSHTLKRSVVSVSLVNAAGTRVATADAIGDGSFRFPRAHVATGYNWVVIINSADADVESHPILITQ